MKLYAVALCILVLALLGIGIALDGNLNVEEQLVPDRTPAERTPCWEKYQEGYEAGYQAGKLAAYQEIAGLLNQKIYELQTSAAEEYQTTEIDIEHKEELNRSIDFTFKPREPIPLPPPPEKIPLPKPLW